MSVVTRADWHVPALADADADVDPFDEVVEYGVEVRLDLVAIALGSVIDLAGPDAELWRWGNELERRDRSIAATGLTCEARKLRPGQCLHCREGDALLEAPASGVKSVLCRNSRRLELVEQEVNARLPQ